MNSTLACIPCFVEHTLHVAKLTTDDEDQQFKIIKQVLAVAAEMELEQSPPEMARKIHRIIREVTGVEDAYQEIKDNSTAFARELMPLLRSEIEAAENHFEAIVRLVIAGNIIDFGADRHFKLKDARERITEALNLHIDSSSVNHLRELMENAGSILYMMDNCGEAVFDRLLIEPFREKITIGIRGYPILNDITPREVDSSDIKDLARIIDTGDSTPGVSMQYSSAEFLDVFNNVDLIIAKGQGNYETLSNTSRPIVFLLRVKCPVVGEKLNADIGSLNVIIKNIA